MYLVKRNNKIYYVEFNDPTTNKKRRVSTGSKNKTEARRFLKDFSVENLLKEEAVPKLTVEDFAKLYIEKMSVTHSKKYVQGIRTTFNGLVSRFGTVLLENLNRQQLEKYFLDQYLEKKYAAHMQCRTLKAALNRAIEWGYLENNPLEKFKLPRLPKQLPLVIGLSELANIIEHTYQPVYGDIFLFAYWTGMRLGEITALRKADVSIDQGIIYIKNNEEFNTKSRKDRVVPIAPAIAGLIKKYMSKSRGKYLFDKGNGLPYLNDAVTKNFKRAVIRAGADKRYHFHTLRHSFASMLAQRGVSVFVIKELLGHADIQTTQVYAHIGREQINHLFDHLDKDRVQS